MTTISKRKRKGKCVYPFPVYQATFEDGVTVRFSVWQPEGKPWDFDHAQQSARVAWQGKNLHYRLLFDAAERGQYNYRPTARDIWYAKRNDAPAIVSAFIEHKSIGKCADPLDIIAPKVKRTTVKEVKTTLSALLAYLDGENTDDSIIQHARQLAA